MAGEGWNRLWVWTQQQIKSDDVCDHQQGHVDDRYRVRGAQLPRQRRKANLDGMVIVEHEIDEAHEIEGRDEQPKERTYPYREKRQDGEHPCSKVPVGGESGEASGDIRADNTWKDKHQPEEAEAVQRSDGALRCDEIHRLEPGQDVHAEAKQPRELT